MNKTNFNFAQFGTLISKGDLATYLQKSHFVSIENGEILDACTAQEVCEAVTDYQMSGMVWYYNAALNVVYDTDCTCVFVEQEHAETALRFLRNLGYSQAVAQAHSMY